MNIFIKLVLSLGAIYLVMVFFHPQISVKQKLLVLLVGTVGILIAVFYNP